MRESLDEFFARQDWPRIEASAGWVVRRDPDDPERLILTVRATDEERYHLLCLCDGYAKRPPSVAFVNGEGSKDDATAWPTGDSEFLSEVKPPPSCFLCMPLTREGLQHHPDWAAKGIAWDPERHTLLDVFNRVQRLLVGPNYRGRGGAP